MLTIRLGMGLLVVSLAAVAFAGPDRPIADVRSLAGDWRATSGASAAAIRIKPDGSYEGTAANGGKTVGAITAVGGEASFRSNTSTGSVTWSREDGKDLLLFVRADGRASARLQRVKKER